MKQKHTNEDLANTLSNILIRGGGR